MTLPRVLRGLLRPYRMSGADERAALDAFFAGTATGFYVDVGANAEGHYTAPFEARGWTGILVEPLPDLADNLRRTRRATVVECLVGSPAEAGTEMALYRGSHTGLSTLHPEEPSQRELVEIVRRPVRTLDDILAAAGAPEGFDFLKVDVEFHELAAMQGFDLERWRPRLIVIEDHAYDRRLHNYIAGHGFRYYRRVNLNSWYVPQSAPQRATLGAWYAFFRKYYVGWPMRALRRRLRMRHRKVEIAPSG